MDTALTEIADLTQIKSLAESRMPADVRRFVQCNGTGKALQANEEAWERWAVRPRALIDVSDLDLSTTVLDEPVALPVLVSPFTLSGLCHSEAEMSVARASAVSDTIMTLSSGASCPPEQIADSGARFWMHVEPLADKGLLREIVERAAAAGARAICLTVSCPIFPLWSHEMMDAFEKLDYKPFIKTNPSVEGKIRAELRRESRRSFTWDDLGELREMSGLPIVLKGIQTAEDAELAVNHGVEAVIVSNHGGFMVDETVGTAVMLTEVVDAVEQRIEVLVDGGIRGGADVLRALALGARAVMIGRLALWGVSAGGAKGCARVMELLREEIEVLMAMGGARDVSEVNRAFLAERDSSLRRPRTA